MSKLDNSLGIIAENISVKYKNGYVALGLAVYL